MGLKFIDFSNKILKYNADVNIIMGQRGDGKTYGALKYAVDEYFLNGSQFVLMRTTEDEIVAKYSRRFVGGIAPYVLKLTGEEKAITYYSGQYLIEEYKENSKDKIKNVIGHVMSLSGWLKYKGANYEKVNTIILDEFNTPSCWLSSQDYLSGYMENLSTIVRHRGDVKVFCLGNTMTRRSPIFDYYGIHITKLEQGKPVLYQAANGLRILVYWVEEMDISESEGARHITVYDGRESKMITGGTWALSDDIVTNINVSGKDYSAERAFECLKGYKTSNKYYFIQMQSTLVIPSKPSLPMLCLSHKIKNAININDEFNQTALLTSVRKLVSTFKILTDKNDNILLDYLL